MAALTLNLPGSSVSDGSGLYNTALQAGLASSELLNNAFNTFNKVGQQIGDKNVAEAWVQAIAAGKSPDEAMALASRAGNSFTSAEALNRLYTQNLSQRQENRAAAKEERDIKDWQDTIAAAKFNRANEIAMSNLDRKAYQANADAVLAADPGIQRYVTLGDMTSAVDKHQLSQADTNFKNTSAAVAASKEAREAEDWKNAIKAAPYNNEIQAAISLLNQGRYEEALEITKRLPPEIQQFIKISNFTDAKDKSLQAQAEARFRNTSSDIAAAEEARKVEDRENKIAAAPYNMEIQTAISLLDEGRYKEAMEVVGTLPPWIQQFIDKSNYKEAESKNLESQAKVNASNASALKTQRDIQIETVGNVFNMFKSRTDDSDVALEQTAKAFGMTTQEVQTLIGHTDTGKDITKSVTERTLAERAAKRFKDKGTTEGFGRLDQDTVTTAIGTSPKIVNEHQQKVIQAANEAETNRLLEMLSWLSKESATKLINSKSKEEFEANKKELKQNLQTNQVMAGGPNAHSGYSSFYNDLDKLEFNSKLNRVGTKDTEKNIYKNYNDMYSSGISRNGDPSLEDIFNNKTQAGYVANYNDLLIEYADLRDKGIRGKLSLKEQIRLQTLYSLLKQGKGKFETYTQGMKDETEFLTKAYNLVNKLEGVDSISFESLGKFLTADTLKKANEEKFAKALNVTMQEVSDKLKEQHAKGINTNLHHNDQYIKVALAMLIQENPGAVSDPQEWLSARFKDFSAEDIIETANEIKNAVRDGSLLEAADRSNQIQLIIDLLNKRKELK